MWVEREGDRAETMAARALFAFASSYIHMYRPEWELPVLLERGHNSQRRLASHLAESIFY